MKKVYNIVIYFLLTALKSFLKVFYKYSADTAIKQRTHWAIIEECDSLERLRRVPQVPPNLARALVEESQYVGAVLDYLRRIYNVSSDLDPTKQQNRF